MIEIIYSMILSIISGLIANFIYDKCGKSDKINLNMKAKKIINNQDTQLVLNKHLTEYDRAQNRKWLNSIIANIFFYSFTYFIIAISIYTVLSFHNGLNGLFSQSNIDFNKTKLGINFVLKKDDYFLVSITLAFIIYIPALQISKKIAYKIGTILDYFVKVTNEKLISIRIMLIIFVSIFISIILYWIINPDVSFWEATKNILNVLFNTSSSFY